MSETRFDLDSVQTGLLQQGLIQIYGEIDDEVYDYVQKCIVICKANGTPIGSSGNFVLPGITVQINSTGGSFHHALMIYDMIRLYGGETTGIVIGAAMSGANLILQGCDVRLASRGSLLHVHNMIAQVSLDLLRDSKKLMEEFKELEEWQAQVYAIYRKRTKKSQKELKVIFEENKPFSPKKALALGFIDGIK